MKRGSINLTFSFDLDMVAGWGHTLDDWMQLVERSLVNDISSYKTAVEVHSASITNYVWRDGDPINGAAAGYFLPSQADQGPAWLDILRKVHDVETTAFICGEYDRSDPEEDESYEQKNLAQVVARQDLHVSIRPLFDDAMKWRAAQQQAA